MVFLLNGKRQPIISHHLKTVASRIRDRVWLSFRERAGGGGAQHNYLIKNKYVRKRNYQSKFSKMLLNLLVLGLAFTGYSRGMAVSIV